jgi:membrane protein YqaA with SNARE-associated domain
LADLTTADHNPLFITAISIVLGAVLGYLMGQFAGILQPQKTA